MKLNETWDYGIKWFIKYKDFKNLLIKKLYKIIICL